MTGRRNTSRGKPQQAAGRPSGGSTRTTDADAGHRSLSPIEEKVLRMRRGVGAPTDLVLGRVGQDRPDVARRLIEIEARALRESGRLGELRREAVAAESADERPQAGLGTRNETKNKIVARLSERTRRR